MKDKNLGIYFLIFSGIYLFGTSYYHGIHFLNSAITIGIILLGIYYILKK